MKLAIVVALLLPIAAAAQTPELDTAERAWKAAERGNSAQLWETAAALFDKAVATAGVLKAHTAEAAVLAWKNARSLDTSNAKAIGLSARDKAFVRSIDVLLPIASTDEVPGLHFTRANVFRQAELLDDAVAGFEHILVNFPDSEVTEYSVMLLLDALNRQGRHSRMGDWVAKLHATPKLLANRPELAESVEKLHVQIQRKRAEALEAKGSFAECAKLYRELAKRPKVERKSELLHNAGVCDAKARKN